MAKAKTVAEPFNDPMVSSFDEAARSEPEPTMSDPAWSEYVMSQFDEAELDAEGCPRVHGLRRVARKLLGPILRSCATVVQTPVHAHAGREGFEPTVVMHELSILWTRPEDIKGGAAFPVHFSEVADVWAGNCDPRFGVYMTALAATRAEGRTFRKALQLNKVAAEEKGAGVGQSGFNSDGIQQSQISVIASKCAQLDLNVKKFINVGRAKFKRFQDVPYDVAVQMVLLVSDYQRDPSKIPGGIKGFDQNWKQELGE